MESPSTTTCVKVGDRGCVRQASATVRLNTTAPEKATADQSQSKAHQRVWLRMHYFIHALQRGRVIDTGCVRQASGTTRYCRRQEEDGIATAQEKATADQSQSKAHLVWLRMHYFIHVLQRGRVICASHISVFETILGWRLITKIWLIIIRSSL